MLSEKFNGFPETHKAATLKAAHCNTSALLKIVADLYEVFKTEFMPVGYALLHTHTFRPTHSNKLKIKRFLAVHT